MQVDELVAIIRNEGLEPRNRLEMVLSRLLAPAVHSDLISRLQAGIDDPMWPHHFEINKRTAQRIIDALATDSAKPAGEHIRLHRIEAYARNTLSTNSADLDDWKADMEQIAAIAAAPTPDSKDAPEAGKPVAPVAQPVACRAEVTVWGATCDCDGKIACTRHPELSRPSPAANGAAERDALRFISKRLDAERGYSELAADIRKVVNAALASTEKKESP